MSLSDRGEAVLLNEGGVQTTKVVLVLRRLLLQLALHSSERTVVLLDEVPGGHTRLGGLGDRSKYLHSLYKQRTQVTKPPVREGREKGSQLRQSQKSETL